MPNFLRILGYSQQKPQVIDNRQDPAKVAIYVNETFPLLKKKRKKKVGKYFMWTKQLSIC